MTEYDGLISAQVYERAYALLLQAEAAASSAFDLVENAITEPVSRTTNHHILMMGVAVGAVQEAMYSLDSLRVQK